MTVTKQRYEICVLPGDGIGPEIMQVALDVLHAVGRKYDIEFTCTEALIGGCAIDACGNALPEATLELARRADAVLLGAVGGPRWDTVDPDKPRPEDGLLGIRKELGLYANLRPVHVYDALVDASPLKTRGGARLRYPHRPRAHGRSVLRRARNRGDCRGDACA